MLPVTDTIEAGRVLGIRDPLIPVKCEKQREALKFLQEHILSDRSFQFSPQLLRRLMA